MQSGSKEVLQIFEIKKKLESVYSAYAKSVGLNLTSICVFYMIATTEHIT